MRRLSTFLSAIGLTFALGAAPASAQTPITGLWNAVGSNASGQSYTGRVAVQQAGEVYRVVWRVGGQTYVGVGIVTGDILSVAFNGGLAVYRITPQGLMGRWTTTRGTRLLREDWRR